MLSAGRGNHRPLKADHSISFDLQRDAIRLAQLRGNAGPAFLVTEAWRTGIAPNRSSRDYIRALRRITIAKQMMPWDGWTQLTLALLQYRTQAFEKALLSSQMAMEILKNQGPDAHAIRAMAHYRLHDLTPARNELALGQQALDALKDPNANEPVLLEEARSLVSPQKASPTGRR